MVTFLKSFIMVAFTMVLISCSSVSVSTDYDQSVDFSKYKTYKWGGANDPNDALLKNQLILQRVYDAIDTSMLAKGYTKVESDPDFVTYPHAGTQEKTDVTSWGYGYGGWWGAGGYPGGTVDVTQYTEGTLFIDMVDTKKNKLIWRGTGTGIVNPPSSPQASMENIKSAVAQVLQDFPPPGKN